MRDVFPSVTVEFVNLAGIAAYAMGYHSIHLYISMGVSVIRLCTSQQVHIKTNEAPKVECNGS